MTQWHVELTCKEPKLLAFLSSVFQEPSCVVIAGDTNFYFKSFLTLELQKESLL